MNLKFFYVNNISKKAKSARSCQVAENEMAFKAVLNQGFRSLFPDDIFLIKNIFNENSYFRKIIFHFILFVKLLFLDRSHFVYSRNLSVLWVGKSLGFKIVWEAHDLPKGKNSKLLMKLKDKLKIVAISDALQLALIEKFAIKKETIMCAHDAVAIELYDKFRSVATEETRRKFDLPLDKKIILHSGSIMKERGSALFEIVLETLDTDWVFVQVGGREEDGLRLQKDNSFSKRFFYITHQDSENLIKLQLCSDALFYMITKETSTYWCCSPMKIFEFLASAKPIVASNIGSLSEIVDPSVAFIFDPENLASLQRALRSLEDAESSKQIAQNALRRVRDKYTWSIRASNIVKFLES